MIKPTTMGPVTWLRVSSQIFPPIAMPKMIPTTMIKIDQKRARPAARCSGPRCAGDVLLRSSDEPNDPEIKPSLTYSVGFSSCGSAVIDAQKMDVTLWSAWEPPRGEKQTAI
jgi:hypothetical protein